MNHHLLASLNSNEVTVVIRLAEEADAQEGDDGLDLPAELAHRETRLKRTREAKAEIEQRARERHEKEKAAHEEKLVT